MGLVYNNFRVFLDARRRGASFESVLTLGRQQMYLSPAEVQLLAREFPEFVKDSDNYPQAGEYCEPWLHRWLDCNRLESMDASNYEGATILHDLNQPIPEQYAGQFSAVIDGGSLEHIFFVTVAISNAMRMTRPGGWLFIASVANNHCGHGFYQFSPEWFFRIFTAENGFEVGDVLLMPHRYPGAELSENHRLFQVVDPAKRGRRVGLVGAQPVLVLASARRVAECELFRRPPYQSDYAERWHELSDANEDLSKVGEQRVSTVSWFVRGVGNRIRRWLPQSIRRYLDGQQQLRDFRLHNHLLYVPWKPVERRSSPFADRL